MILKTKQLLTKALIFFTCNDKIIIDKLQLAVPSA